MQPINMIIYFWDKTLRKRLHVLEADIITIKKKQKQKKPKKQWFDYHINGLHLLWDTVSVHIYIYIYYIYRERERERNRQTNGMICKYKIQWYINIKYEKKNSEDVFLMRFANILVIYNHLQGNVIDPKECRWKKNKKKPQQHRTLPNLPYKNTSSEYFFFILYIYISIYSKL